MAADILEKIAADKRIQVEEEKKVISFNEMKQKAYETKSRLPDFSFEEALKQHGMSFICEVKKASPSKGIIAEDFPYVQIAKDYEMAGADCLSVLTEPKYFLGNDKYLQEIRNVVNIPILRKDFTVDFYQIYQAKVIGADAVLLICALLDEEFIREGIRICDELGLSALVETHDEEEIRMALRAGARIIGVNNRNLRDFTVDIHNSMRMRQNVPDNVAFIAESGIKTGADVAELRSANVNGVLIGETLMRSKDKARMLNELRGTKVKICGIKREEDLAMVNELQPDYIGFVFADSKRKVTDEQAAKLFCMLDTKARAGGKLKVCGVFVNDSISHIVSLCKAGIIDVVQLHGDETEEYLQKLRDELNNLMDDSASEDAKDNLPRNTDKRPSIKIIKAIRVRGEEDLEDGSRSSADYVLLDTYHKDAYGGTGETFDSSAIPEGYRPYFLAGGISASNVQDKIKRLRPYAVDVSSSVETDGVKDYDKIQEFMKKVREINE